MNEPSNESRPSRTRAAAIAGLVVGVIALGAAAALDGLGTRTDTPREAARPITVATFPAQLESSYTVRRHYTGRVEPRRHSRVGFELPGTVIEILADEGDIVRQGEVLARIDTERLRAERRELESQLARTRADLGLARITYERLVGLVREGAASQQAVDDAREGLRALVAAEQLATARLDTNSVWLNKSEIRSPFNAVVVRRKIDEGRVIEAGEPLLELQETTRPEARVGLAGHAASAFTPGDRHRVRLQDREVPAIVKAILPLRDAYQRTVDLILTLDVDPSQIRPGDLVTVTVEDEVPESGFWVPVTALTEGVRGLWAVHVAVPLDEDVEIPGATHRVGIRAVELLHVRSEKAFVRGTLAQQDLVVAGGVHRIVAGQSVKLAAES